jgi:hypothetical protein
MATDADKPALELNDPGVRDGKISFSLTSKPHDSFSLDTVLDVWRNFHKLLIAIDAEVGVKIDWKVSNIVVDREGDSQRISLTVCGENPEGGQAEQLFVDLMNLLKDRKTKANG